MFHEILCKMSYSEQWYRHCLNGSFPKAMCLFEALLTSVFDDENKYNTKPIDEREECWMPLFQCASTISYWPAVSKSCAKRVMEMKLCMCG